jgi:sugar transferase (PEP-CTERM system associated)
MIRIFGYYVSKIYLYLGMLEAVDFLAALHLGTLTRFGWRLGDGLNWSSVATSAISFALIMVLAMIAMGLYQRGVQEQSARFSVRVGIAFLLGAAMLAVIFFLFPSLFIGRGVTGLSLMYSIVAISVTRSLFARFAGIDARKRRVLVLGSGMSAADVAALARDDPGLGFTIVGFVPLPTDTRHVSENQVIVERGSLLDLAIANEADEIVVAADDRRKGLPVNDLLDCKMSGFEVYDLLGFFEKELALVKIDMLQPSWIVFSAGFHIGVTGLYGKRLFDVCASLLMLTVAAPVLSLVAVASLVESRGRDPVFYHQVRVGQNGRLFRLYKFRTMRVDAEADGTPQWARANDPRITRLGAFLRKTRLDELPQILNVLKGHMSLVGPRPERPEFVNRLSAVIPFYSERHRVKPGVTGWAQLLYPYGSTEEDAKRKLEFDLYYVKHAGIMLDLVILLQTVEVVLLGKGAR